jgi:Putative auto-transporter adhesin, head GIN domain
LRLRQGLGLAAALIALASPAAANDRRYAVGDFERVEISGPYSVSLTVGGPSTAVASGSQRSLDDVSIYVQGRTLRIRPNNNAWGGYPGQAAQPATIVLTTRILRSASLIGTGSLAVDGARGLQVDLALAGAGRLTATRLDVDRLGVGVRGSGTAQLSGRGDVVTAAVEGSASLDGQNLSVQTLTLGAATAADIRLSARRAAAISATGLGHVVITGGAACTLNGPRAGDVSCGHPAR